MIWQNKMIHYETWEGSDAMCHQRWPKVDWAYAMSIQLSPFNLSFKSPSERLRNNPKQMNTIKLWRKMSTNTILLQKPKGQIKACVALLYSDLWPSRWRGNPKQTNRKKKPTKNLSNPPGTSQDHKHQRSINLDPAFYFQREVTSTNEQLYFPLLDPVVVRDPSAIKVESP